MLKKYIFLLLITGLTTPALAAHITGILKNAAPGERVELFVPHYYLDGHSDNYWAELDADRAFTIEATLPEPQLIAEVFRRIEELLGNYAAGDQPASRPNPALRVVDAVGAS